MTRILLHPALLVTVVVLSTTAGVATVVAPLGAQLVVPTLGLLMFATSATITWAIPPRRRQPALVPAATIGQQRRAVVAAAARPTSTPRPVDVAGRGVLHIVWQHHPALTTAHSKAPRQPTASGAPGRTTHVPQPRAV